jgi:large subunit ribosomal protein L4
MEKKVIVKKVAKKTVVKKPVLKKVIKKAVSKKVVEKKVEAIAFNPKVWDVVLNKDLVAQVYYVQNTNSRTSTAHAKTRAQVSGGGRKPWKQKGTGRARHGSIRSPIWVGGGVTFAPNDTNWKVKINKKMTKKAICMMLSQRLREGNLEVVVVDEKKTLKDLRTSITSQLDLRKYSLVISDDVNVKRSLSNVARVDFSTPMNMSLIHIIKARKILLTKESVNIIEKRLLNEK